MSDITEFLDEIYAYFAPDEHDNVPDPFRRLDDADYQHYLSLVDQAIESNPDILILWFWRGWGLQFFGEQPEAYIRHPQFEHIEQAYERVVELDPSNSPARLMLTYLHWENARRSVVEPVAKSILKRVRQHMEDYEEDGDRFWETVSEFESFKSDLNSYYAEADYSASRELWAQILIRQVSDVRLIATHEGILEDLFFSLDNAVCEVAGKEYRFFCDSYDWMKIVNLIDADIMDESVLPRYHHGLAYFLLTLLGWGADAPQIVHSFQIVRKRPPNPGLWADATAYLASIQSEHLGNDPEKGMQLFEELQAFAADPEKFEAYGDREAFQSFETFVEDFLWDSPNYRIQYPDKCLDLIEQSVGQSRLNSEKVVGRPLIVRKGMYEKRITNRLKYIAGELCYQVGRYHEAVDYLESARKANGYDDKLAWELTVAYAMTERFDEAGAALAHIENQDEKIRVLAPIMQKMHFTQEQSASLLKAFSQQLNRIEEQGNTLNARLMELGESLIEELTNLRIERPRDAEAQNRNQDELAAQLADQVASKVSVQIDKLLGHDSQYYEEIEDKCRWTWPEHWIFFPPDLQALIISSEISEDVWPKQRRLTDYAIVVMQWGKVAELAFWQSFTEPLGRYLDGLPNERRPSSLRSDLTTTKFSRTDNIELKNNSWHATMQKSNFSKTVGLLEAAQKNSSNAVYQFLADSDYDCDLWTGYMVTHLREVIQYRNQAAHPGQALMRRDASTVKAILVSKGVLAAMGDVFKKFNRQ